MSIDEMETSGRPVAMAPDVQRYGPRAEAVRELVGDLARLDDAARRRLVRAWNERNRAHPGLAARASVEAFRAALAAGRRAHWINAQHDAVRALLGGACRDSVTNVLVLAIQEAALALALEDLIPPADAAALLAPWLAAREGGRHGTA